MSTVKTGTLWAYITPHGNLLPSTIRGKEGDSNSALLRSRIEYRGVCMAACKLVRVNIEYPTFGEKFSGAETPWEDKAAEEISSYLVTGMNHMTNSGRCNISKIIAACSALPKQNP